MEVGQPMTGQPEHSLQLRTHAMRIALDLTRYNRGDAMTVIRLAEGLVDHYVHPLTGLSEGTLLALEELATCR
jgi:hypothetical protein